MRTKGAGYLAYALIDAVVDSGWTDFANLGRVALIRPDAEHPLVIDINVREMAERTGEERAVGV